ncbi:hypothetical protein [Dyadobacter sp. CY312]|uniref:hypothetical protein n=1 Tax=Dyadobacter sp. CY312 TaxID=2907303 RepID=UPI001F1E574E|nr:hypothetical protein [Dyadobacter sp. CY312]MCE7044692.1 hypothetical protein [Dyadobacter sp. CY312]
MDKMLLARQITANEFFSVGGTIQRMFNFIGINCFTQISVGTSGQAGLKAIGIYYTADNQNNNLFVSFSATR